MSDLMKMTLSASKRGSALEYRLVVDEIVITTAEGKHVSIIQRQPGRLHIRRIRSRPVLARPTGAVNTLDLELPDA